MHILLIDDDRESLENLGLLLERKGFSSQRFTDPQKALAAARSGGFDLVITDYEMPRLDGLEVLRQIRQISPATPVILMSACPDDNLDRVALEAGSGCTFFSKPLDLKLFMRTLARIRDEL
ncbi:response regulator [bacterium]|nr:response regulator [bacterium]